MIYLDGQNIRDYIQMNINEVNNFMQNGFAWRYDSHGNDLLEPLIQNSSADFDAAINFVPNLLDRNLVLELYNTDLYYGFIATLLWGGYHSFIYTRPKFSAIANLERTEFDEKLNNIQLLMGENRIADAYLSLLPGADNYINGLRISYFTKILYYLGQMNDVNPSPLIFDQFSMNIHIALLIADGQINDFYTINPRTGQFRFIDRTGMNCYFDYNQRMANVENVNSSSQLESILFGWPSHNRNDMNNPRAVVKRIINQYIMGL